jgi:hypothetical protein
MPAAHDSGAEARGSPGNGVAGGGVRPPETILFTVEPVTITSRGITYRTERVTLTATRVRAAHSSPPPAPPASDEQDRSIAAKVFELLTALDPDNRLRKAPPIKVFNLYYRQGLQPAEIARRCKCDRSLIFDRLTAIKQQLPWSPDRLRELSPHIEAMEDAVRESKARSIYRKGAFSGDDDRDEPLD